VCSRRKKGRKGIFAMPQECQIFSPWQEAEKANEFNFEEFQGLFLRFISAAFAFYALLEEFYDGKRKIFI
jgi:hypothetical protein